MAKEPKYRNEEHKRRSEKAQEYIRKSKLNPMSYDDAVEQQKRNSK